MLAGTFNAKICDHFHRVIGDCKISKGRDKLWWMHSKIGNFKVSLT